MNQIKPNKGKATELVNENIPNTDLLVIDDDGKNHGVMNRDKALRLANDRDLDLVVVSVDAKPMVAKLMDYSKYRYEQQKKLREIKKNQLVIEVKEIRLSPTIDKHDFETKCKQTIKFLEKGNKVKVSIRFYGRMITHTDVGASKMNEFIEAIGDAATLESKPKMEGRSMIAMLNPNNTK